MGCKVNQADANELSRAFSASLALDIADDIESADLVVVHTCTVTGEADSKTKKAIRRLLAANPRAWLMAVGCAVAIDPDSYLALSPRVVVAADSQTALAKASGLMAAPFEPPATGPPATEPPATRPQPAPKPQQAPKPLLATALRTRQNLKAQDGCDADCSYCIVLTARGPSRSLPLAALVESAQAAEEAGVRELVLTGVNLGSYRQGGIGLSGLIEALLASTGKCRFRLSSLEPMDATEDIVGLIAQSGGRVCAHLHLPLQSGSDAVLASMGRPYTTSEYADRVASARRYLPGLAVSADVIVGYPGESAEDFQATLDFCSQMAFMRLHVFRYSPRAGTRAAQMPGQVVPQVKAERSLRLRQLAASLTAADLGRRIGQRELALVERPGVGRAECYHQVALDKALPVGQLVPVLFCSHNGKLLECI